MSDLRGDLAAAFRWRSDPPVWPESRTHYADDSGWFRSSDILSALGPALADLHGSGASVVMGTEAKGMVLAALVAVELGVGMAEVRKEPERASDDDQWLSQRTPPDYRDRNVLMAVRRTQLRPGDRVLFVDDWVATGGQLRACSQLVDQADAHWVGAAVVVDGLEQSSVRRELGVRSLMHIREL